MTFVSRCGTPAHQEQASGLVCQLASGTKKAASDFVCHRCCASLATNTQRAPLNLVCHKCYASLAARVVKIKIKALELKWSLELN
jgi:hypothetical protein